MVLTLTSKTYKDDIKITKEECDALKTELHAIGGANFMRKYLQGETRYSIKEILYTFGYILVTVDLKKLLSPA
jgi:predicted nucleotidyltransferase